MYIKKSRKKVSVDDGEERQGDEPGRVAVLLRGFVVGLWWICVFLLACESLDDKRTWRPSYSARTIVVCDTLIKVVVHGALFKE